MAKRKRSTRIVRISNPTPGHARYTNLRSALRLVARGRAVWTPDGTLELLPLAVLTAIAAQQSRLSAERRDEQDTFRQRGWRNPKTGKFDYRIWWNGADRNPNAQHRPGEVCS